MRSAAPSRTETAFDLFFAFIDGVFDYVCAECTAICCKGHGLAGSLERELRPLFAHYPELETMAVSRDGDQIALAAPISGCLMLRSDNLCRIEKELGKDKKPNVCNLFPFNSFARVGKTIVVTPHFLCPLRAIVPPRPGDVPGTHRFVEAGIRQSHILNRDYVKSMISAVSLPPSLTPLDVIERERKFRDLCAQALGRLRFSEVLMTASSEPRALRTFLNRAGGVLGYEAVSGTKSRDLFDDLFLAFASPYRIRFVDLAGEDILRALGVAEMIVRRAWAGDTPIPTLKGLANTVSTFLPLQALFAEATRSFDFGRVAQKNLSFRNAELTFAAFVTVQLSAQQGVLKALEEAIPPSMAVADRSILLMRLGELMQAAKSKKKSKHGVVVDRILSVQDSEHVSHGVPSVAA